MKALYASEGQGSCKAEREKMVDGIEGAFRTRFFYRCAQTAKGSIGFQAADEFLEIIKIT
jgi:hypothetical protein